MSINVQLPKFSSKLLFWALPESLKDPVLGDLSEEFIQRAERHPIAARFWFQKQAVRSALQFLWKTKRGLMMFLISVAIFLGLIIFAMVLSGGIDMFIDVPSLMLVVPPALAFTIAATSWQEFKAAFALVMSSELDVEGKAIESAKHVFDTLGHSSVIVGVLTTMIGWVAMASNLDDMASFGPAFAVSILTMVYALIIKAVCYVASQKLAHKLN